MLPKACAFIAASLDGFIAGPDGSLDWLTQAGKDIPEGEDCGYEAFMGGVDALVMGRRTFEKVLTFTAWPYAGKQVTVLTGRAADPPWPTPPEVSYSSEEPLKLMQRLGKEGFTRVYVDGGATISGFLSVGLLSEITVTVIPVALGGGIPLFSCLSGPVDFTLLGVKPYDFGFVQLKYKVKDAVY